MLMHQLSSLWFGWRRGLRRLVVRLAWLGDRALVVRLVLLARLLLFSFLLAFLLAIALRFGNLLLALILFGGN